MASAQEVTLVWHPTAVSIGSILVDASIKENHHTELDSTDSPVEQGVDITDHIRKKPDVVTITGIVTNYRLASNPATSVAGFYPGTAETAYQDLIALADNPSLVTVVTGLRVYQNMSLKSLEVPRDAAIGESLQFTVVLKQIQIVQNQTVLIARSSANQPNQNGGKVTPQPTNQSLAVQGGTFLKAHGGPNVGGLF